MGISLMAKAWRTAHRGVGSPAVTQGSISHGLSGDTPSNLLEVLTGSASTTIFFPLLTFS